MNGDFSLALLQPAFFDEAADNLAQLEQRLLTLALHAVDDEAVNALFRCAHSIKGGAAAFGFADMAELTHEMETLLDKLRRHELVPSAAMVSVLLEATDALTALLTRHRDGDDGSSGAALATTALMARIGALAGAAGAADAPAPPQAAADAIPRRLLALRAGPLNKATDADHLIELFREIPALGQIVPLETAPDAASSTSAAACTATGTLRHFRIATSASDAELLDLFGFYLARDQVQLTPLTPPPPPHSAQAGRPLPARASSNVPGTAPIAARGAPASRAQPVADVRKAPEPTTLRVAVDKLDHVAALVRELIALEAALARQSTPPQPALAELQHHTHRLHEAVVAMRMAPLSTVFSRFPRMLRDLAFRLGKQVELVTEGGATELDRALVEKITDPLTHLVRNACDHGIEPASERLALGKPQHGTITLAALAQGGCMVIEVRDDGRGLHRERLLAKARERGLSAPDTLPDSAVWAFALTPGLSTVDTVTDVSGRGVGMDVVRRSVSEADGTLEIDSTEGVGTVVRLRLPLAAR